MWVAAVCGWAGHAAAAEPSLFVTIVMHSEQNARYDLNPLLFEQNRTNLYQFAGMLARHGVQFDFQSDWTFLAGTINFDTGGRAETGGTNIVAWMERDLGFAIDPHNHVNQSAYTYADVAELIRRCGATPTAIAGGFIALPVTNSEWELFQQPIAGGVYTDATWTAGALWGGGSGNHTLDTNTWFSGVYCPRDGTNMWQHQDGNLPDIGGFGGRHQIWTNLDMLLAWRDAGLLCTGSLYTCNLMVNMSSLNPSFTAAFDAQLQLYTNVPAIEWVNLVQLTNIWATAYERRPSRRPWMTTNDLDADGMIDGWEVTNFCGTCESDGGADGDTDGWSDREEFVADTQPTNAASAFSSDWNYEDPNVPVVGIPDSSPDRRYRIERATNLLYGAWRPVITNIPGNGGLLQLTFTNRPDTAFYRTGVTRP